MADTDSMTGDKMITAEVRNESTVVDGLQLRCGICHGHAGWRITSCQYVMAACPSHIGDVVRILLEPKAKRAGLRVAAPDGLVVPRDLLEEAREIASAMGYIKLVDKLAPFLASSDG